VWESFGFRHSPYDARSLKCAADDIELLVNRKSEYIELCTSIQSRDSGILIISGRPGVGKTSFFNVAQFLIESNRSPCRRKMIAARELCPIQSNDDERKIAFRALRACCKSIEKFCHYRGYGVPSEVKKLLGWYAGVSSEAIGGSVSILGNGLGFSHSINLQDQDALSFETLKDLLEIILFELKNSLKMDGVFIVLDNVENLDDAELSDLLMSFRDTLFSIEGIWWVIIGQEGLGSLLSVLDSRVSDRISTEIGLKPLSLGELHQAITLRVKKFHTTEAETAPLSQSVHEKLYQSSGGEIRYIFQKSQQICASIVNDFMERAISIQPMQSGGLANIGLNAIDFRELLGDILASGVIDDKTAFAHLAGIVSKELENLKLSNKDREILKKIGVRGSARSNEYAEFGLNSGQNFSSNYLIKLHNMKLLFQAREGKAVVYSLRGLAKLARDYDLL